MAVESEGGVLILILNDKDQVGYMRARLLDAATQAGLPGTPNRIVVHTVKGLLHGLVQDNGYFERVIVDCASFVSSTRMKRAMRSVAGDPLFILLQ